MVMNNKGQLGLIEFKFFMYGLIIGLLIAFVAVSLGCNEVFLPRLGFMCGG